MILHSPDYRTRFEADFKKSLARIPLYRTGAREFPKSAKMLVLLAASALQLGAFLFFQTLIRRTAEAVSSVPTPAVETPAQVPAGDAPAPESDTGFGWPEQPAE